MNRRQKIIVSVTGIFLVLLILVGLTYAFFVTRIRGNNNPSSISVTTANLVVEYGDGNGMLKAINHIQPGDPIEFAEVDENGDFILGQDGKPIKHTTKTFTVENKGNDTATYSLVLTDITNTLERNQDLEFTLTKNGVEVTEGLDLNHIAAGTHQILLPKVTIAEDATDTYTLAVTYREAGIDQSEDMNSTIEFKIDIENEKTTWNNANEGTLLYAIKNNKTDATMGSTEDDYGTSYYYKGDANNYLSYSNMCWRIVRVQGDGIVKLMLVDDEKDCKSYTQPDNSNMGENYGDLEHIKYSNSSGFIQYENSNFPKTLNEWATKTGNYSSRAGDLLDTKELVETDWCTDTSIYQITTEGSDEAGNTVYDKETAYEWYEKIVYNGNNRATANKPILKCNFKGLENSKATRIESTISTLTIDEGLISIENNISYIAGNGFGLMRTITPGINEIAIMNSSYIKNYYDMTYIDYARSDRSLMFDLGEGGISITMPTDLRPVIAINSNVKIKTDTNNQYTADGSQTNPYEIK